jgi:hypothetical protein
VAKNDGELLMARLIKRGAASVELALNEGMLRWVDEAGRPVAWARATPTLAFDPFAGVVTWAAAWPGMAGLRCTPPPPGPPIRRPASGAMAVAWAQEAAERAGVIDLAVPLGPPTEAVLHLALGAVVAGDWPGGDAALAERRAASGRWAVAQLARAAGLAAEAPAPEAADALRALGAMAALSASALSGTAEGLALVALAERAPVWAGRLPEGRLWVQVAIERERARLLPPEARAAAASSAAD